MSPPEPVGDRRIGLPPLSSTIPIESPVFADISGLARRPVRLRNQIHTRCVSVSEPEMGIRFVAVRGNLHAQARSHRLVADRFVFCARRHSFPILRCGFDHG